VPWPAIDNVVPVHDAGAVAVVHSLTDDAESVVPVPAWSFASALIVWVAFNAPEETSAVNAGTPTTVGVIVDDPVCPTLVFTWYVTVVATPVKTPVHDAPAMALGAEQGVKVTTPVEVFTQ
jgi:hypothetical protein